MSGLPRRWVAAGLLAMLAGGCLHAPPSGVYRPMPATGVPLPVPLATANPALVPATNRDLLWDQLVDVIDDYFRIEREERVRLVGEVLTEGRIDTYPTLGATIFEPHLGDSVTRYDRWESTLQTIRRRATVRVIPAEQGYLVDVSVIKELEALSRPVHPSAGLATFPGQVDVEIDRPENDDQFDEQLLAPIPGEGEWVPIGRDIALEQQILLQLQARFGSLPVLPAGAPILPSAAPIIVQ